MEKRKVFVLFVLLLFAFSISCVFAAASKVDKNIINEPNNQKIRVVVHFTENNNFNSKGLLSASDSPIASEKINYRAGNNLFVSLTKEEIEDLAKLSNVESINKEKKYQILLQNSVPLIRANDSWGLQVDSLNLTGDGQTVCIIDTGINYSHPDFGSCFGNNDAGSSCKVIGGWDYCADDFDCTSEDDNPMDVEGHGTHVSGIAVASGSINGVAPSSKIIMIKAGNATGSFWDSELKKSIDWCVNNASKFNISVISMSLGGGMFDNYCDEYSDGDLTDEYDTIDIVSSINAAIEKNISVIAASGNVNSATHISSPACIQNVIPVGNIQKNDNFYTVFNRNFMVKILAPGVNINSTILAGVYSGNTWTGTSMSTPHVAGAVLILNQFLKSRGRTMTPSQIEDLLNSTGKQIQDPVSGRYFSRVNIYYALLSLDDVSPSIELISPDDDLVSSDDNKTFICNVSDWQLNNLTLSVWNSSGLYYNETKNISGKINQSEFNLTEMPDGNYNWNCLAFDNVSNSAYSANNFSVTIGGINLELSSPKNNSETNTTTIDFVCNVTSSNDRELKNMSFFIFKNNVLLKSSSLNISGIINGSIFSYTLIDEVNYTWGCETYSNESDYSAKNYTVSYEKITIPTPRTSSGGGGGGGSTTISLSESQLSSGVSKKFNSGEKVNIKINNQNHSLQLNKILNNSANLTIRSEPIIIIMSLGEERRVNLTSAEYYDLYIKVENITKNSADVKLKEINELISPVVNSTSKGKRYDISENNNTPKEPNNILVYSGIVAILTIGLLLLLFLTRDKNPSKKRTRVKK